MRLPKRSRETSRSQAMPCESAARNAKAYPLELVGAPTAVGKVGTTLARNGTPRLPRGSIVVSAGASGSGVQHAAVTLRKAEITMGGSLRYLGRFAVNIVNAYPSCDLSAAAPPLRSDSMPS